MESRANTISKEGLGFDEMVKIDVEFIFIHVL